MLMKPVFLKSTMNCRIFLGIEYHKVYRMSNLATPIDMSPNYISTINAGNGGPLLAPSPYRKRLLFQLRVRH